MGTNDREDIAGALETLERREAHLAKLVFPAIGEQPARPPHWRDEKELRALRVLLRRMKEQSGVSVPAQALELLVDASEAIEALLDVDTSAERLNVPEIRELVDRIDEYVADAE